MPPPRRQSQKSAQPGGRASVDGERPGPASSAARKGTINTSKRPSRDNRRERPKAKQRQSDAYLRFIPRTEMDIAVVGCGVCVTLDASARRVKKPDSDVRLLTIRRPSGREAICLSRGSWRPPKPSGISTNDKKPGQRRMTIVLGATSDGNGTGRHSAW